MSELSAVKKAIQLDKNQPHLNNYEIVLELASIEDRLDALEAKDNSSAIQGLKQSIASLENGLIDGLTKQVNYLQDKVKELEADCVRTTDLGEVSVEAPKEVVAPVEAAPEAQA